MPTLETKLTEPSDILFWYFSCFINANFSYVVNYWQVYAKHGSRQAIQEVKFWNSTNFFNTTKQLEII